VEEVNALKTSNTDAEFLYFQSEDKPHERRVNLKTGLIESLQDGKWYHTSQTIYEVYLVDSQYIPWKKIRR